MPKELIQTILHFWFGNSADGFITAEQQRLWWGKDTKVDAYIKQYFLEDLCHAIAGDYEEGLQEPRGTLALIILLDQFSRHMHRDSLQAYTADPIALQWAQQGVARNQDKQLSLIERVFFYLPFEHAEDSAMQQQSVALFYALHKQAPHTQQDTFKEFYQYAKYHQTIIERFGRFPHRNVILGRQSTAAELAFLKEPHSSF